jgi:hypothetical protein
MYLAGFTAATYIHLVHWVAYLECLSTCLQEKCKTDAFSLLHLSSHVLLHIPPAGVCGCIAGTAGCA